MAAFKPPSSSTFSSLLGLKATIMESPANFMTSPSYSRIRSMTCKQTCLSSQISSCSIDLALSDENYQFAQVSTA